MPKGIWYLHLNSRLLPIISKASKGVHGLAFISAVKHSREACRGHWVSQADLCSCAVS
jgi:hypothetical protein